MFEIRQRIYNTYIKGKLADVDYIHVGYVEEEFFAQEFCNKHEDCIYGQVIPYKYTKELETQLITDDKDLEIMTIPIKKWEP